MGYSIEREKEILRREAADKYGQRFDDINSDQEDEDLSDCFHEKASADLIGKRS